MLPVDIYKHAVAAMHSVQAPAYLQYDTHVSSNIHGTIISQHVKHIIRTGDANDITQDEDTELDPRATPFKIEPDLFLGHSSSTTNAPQPTTLTSGLDVSDSSSLKTIAVVTVRSVNYNVTSAGTDEIAGCPGAIHLKLAPMRDPLLYNLRVLWIDPRTAKICRAVAVFRAHVGAVKTIAPITLNLDADGFIKSYSTFASAHFFLGTTSIGQDATYDNREPVDESVWTAAKNTSL